MRFLDQVGRALFVALAVGLGWGIRGDFGHNIGAMFPGAALGLGLCYVSGQRSLFLWMPVIGALAALGIGTGGTMSYGLLHGYAQADSLVNYGYGFLTLFLQGAAWGTFGGAIIGLLLERTPMRTGEWLGWLGSIWLGGWMAHFLICDLGGFEINPTRNNSSVAFMGAAFCQIAWLAAYRKTRGLRGALLGFLGFGLGMSGGRLLGNLANVLQGPYGFTINHWNVMEVSCGFIGGFLYCFGMVDRDYPEPPEGESMPLNAVYGAIFSLGVVPLLHRLKRITPNEKLTEWAKSLTSYQYDNAESLAQTTLYALDGVCVLGFVGVAIWLVIHFQRRQRWAAFPVLWLSLCMLLFQNLNALYFFYPSDPKRLNMHNLFWIMFGLMCAYALVVRPRPLAEQGTAGAPERFRWWAWTAFSMVALAGIVYAAGYVNGEHTMRTASTRWPIWSWTMGPFPGRAPQ